MLPPNSGYPGSAPIGGFGGFATNGQPAWLIGPHGHTAARVARRPALSARSSSCASRLGVASSGLVTNSVFRRRTVFAILVAARCPTCRTATRYRDDHSSVKDHCGAIRAGPARRADPHGRQEDWPHPRGRRMEGPRSTDEQNQRREKGPHRIRLRALGRRRSLPAGLLRDPARREGHHLHSIPSTRRRLLRYLRHHPDRTHHDR